jgi:hypothetical protein
MSAGSAPAAAGAVALAALALCACGGGLRVESVSPASVSARGGERVTVRGDGFKAGMSAWVGEVAVTVEVKDARTAELTLPTGRAGKADVRVQVDKSSATLEQGLELLPLALHFAELPAWQLPVLPGPASWLSTAPGGLLAAGEFGASLLRLDGAGPQLTPLPGLSAEDGGMPPVRGLVLQRSGAVGVLCTASAAPLHWLEQSEPGFTLTASSGGRKGSCLGLALGQSRASPTAFVAWREPDGGTTLLSWERGGEPQPLSTPPLPGTLHALLPLDTDGDGDEDLLVAGRDAEARAESWVRTEDGGFVVGASLLRTGEVRALVPLDVDADGDPDVLGAGAGADSLWLNDGTGRFADDAWRRLPFDRSEAHGAAAADLDLDGQLDVVLAVPGALDRLLLATDGGFVDATPGLGLSPGAGGRCAAAFDLEGDGDLDLATLLPDGGLRVRVSVPAPGEATAP